MHAIVPIDPEHPSKGFELAKKGDWLEQHQNAMVTMINNRKASDDLPEELLNILRHTFAKSTVTSWRSQWQLFLRFRMKRPREESLDRSASIFVATHPTIGLSARKTYASNLSAMMGHFSIPCPTLKLTRRGLANLGADIPEEVAFPATRQDVDLLVRSLNLQLATAVWLMWKTASRWDDVSHLTRDSFLVCNQNEIIIWFAKSKTNRKAAPKANSLAHVLDNNDWLTDVKTSKPRKQQNISSRKSFTLWTDSSTIGWGAVLINEQTQEVKIVADKWTPSDKNLHINILEAKAVRLALGLLDGIDNSVRNLKIDNTSVVATVGKGYSKSEALNFEILQIQLLATRRNILIPKPSYVRPNDNIADHWSRIFDERHG